MCSVAKVEQGGVVQQELATSEEEVAGDGIISRSKWTMTCS